MTNKEKLIRWIDAMEGGYFEVCYNPRSEKSRVEDEKAPWQLSITEGDGYSDKEVSREFYGRTEDEAYERAIKTMMSEAGKALSLLGDD